MKVIDLNNLNSLPPDGKVVKFYDQNNKPFKGYVMLNQWLRPIFYRIEYVSAYGYTKCTRMDFVPKGWDEFKKLKDADNDAGSYADMPVFRGATE